MKRAFQVKQRAFPIIFKGLSIGKNCLRHESAPLNKIVVIAVLQLLLTVLGKFPWETSRPENSHLEYSQAFH